MRLESSAVLTSDVWVEVDLSALRHNAAQVKTAIGPNVQLMAVVKGNGFGHGYVEPARAFLQGGATWLGVTRLDEALILRDGGITAPILIMAPIQPQNADVAVANDLSCAVDNLVEAQALAHAAEKQGTRARIQVKVDTGMGRLGVRSEDVSTFAAELARLGEANVTVEGIFTHFARATDADLQPTEAQIKQFDVALAQFAGGTTGKLLRHAANSAATLRLESARFDMVRVGTLLYGQFPGTHVPRTLDLKATWKLKARVCSVKQLPSGSAIGYGAEYVTRRPTRTAVVPIGFADGFTLVPEGPVYRLPPLKLLAKKYKRNLSVTIRGKAAPILGRVSMQLCVADVTDIPGAEVGDEVIVPALRLATGAHVPRIYLDG